MTSALSPDQLLLLKNKIADLIAEANEEMEQLTAASQPVTLDQQSVGRVSRIDAIQQQQMAKARLLQVKQRLLGLKNASLRLVQGLDTELEYGYCESCDEPILFERLQFNPAVLRCIKCAD